MVVDSVVLLIAVIRVQKLLKAGNYMPNEKYVVLHVVLLVMFSLDQFLSFFIVWWAGQGLQNSGFWVWTVYHSVLLIVTIMMAYIMWLAAGG